jgi:hypothetical protein
MAPSVMAPSVIAPSVMGAFGHGRLQIGLASLVRWIVLVGKILSIPHHLHDVDRSGSMGNHATSGRTGTDCHHAGHRDRSRNNCCRENNGELAHLALLSRASSVRCGDGQASRKLPPLRLFWGKNARTADIALCPAAHLGSYSPRIDVWASTSRESPRSDQLTCGRVCVHG